MKRIGLFTLISALFISASAFASTGLQQYSSTFHPLTTKATTNLLHPPTAITVVNATSDYVYVVVPNSPIYDRIAPGLNDHITNSDPNIWYTNLQVKDSYHNTFFNYNLCRLAIVTVYGYYGHYSWNVDDHLCN